MPKFAGFFLQYVKIDTRDVFNINQIILDTFLVDDALLRVSQGLNLVEGILQYVLSGAEMYCTSRERKSLVKENEEVSTAPQL